jgi:hypothetical protein
MRKSRTDPYPPKVKRVPLFVAGKQLSIHMPQEVWKQMKYIEINTGKHLIPQMFELVAEHYGTDDEEEIYDNLKAINASEFVCRLLAKHLKIPVENP